VEIKVEIPSQGKTATLEVENDHDVAFIVEVLCEELSLGDDRRWSLTSRRRAMDNSKTLQELDVRNGDRFELIQAKTESLAETQPTTVTKPRNEVTQEGAFVAEHRCNCGNMLTWVSRYERFFCFPCIKYPPTCSICKKDLFWVPERSRYYCNACGSYDTSIAL